MRGYCAAVRSALTDDGLPPLSASGLKLHERLTHIAESLEWLSDRLGALPGGLDRLRRLLGRGLEETAALWPPVRAAYRWVRRVAHLLGNEANRSAREVRRRLGRLVRRIRRAAAADPDASVLRSTRPLRPGDAELLAGTILVLRVGRRAADQQRPGTPVRKSSLSRASGEWPPAGVAGPGGAGFGARGVGSGDAAATGRGPASSGGLRGTLAGTARPVGAATGGATTARALPPRPRPLSQ